VTVGTTGGGFIYNGEEGGDVPRGATHVEIHPHVMGIKDWAFYQFSSLITINLGEGLEEIGEGAFSECTSLRDITIPRAVKIINGMAFLRCTQLTHVLLGKGLK
jgi:hypothetical protein